MREIKFRAWLPSEKRMERDRFYINQWDGKCHYTEPYHYEHEDKVVIYDCGEEEPILMQYTGLKDKNGKEIYEGDIVKEVYVPIGSYPDVVEYYKEGVIVWGYKSFAIQLKIEGTMVLDELRKLSYHRTERKVYKHPTQGEGWIDNHTSFHRIEVIGNIYENPELIK